MKFPFLVHRAFLIVIVSGCPAAEPERMSFLDNGQVKVGVDLKLGGAITWLSRGHGENMVNSFDYGRQIQLSYYSGPVPYETAGQKPSEHWRHLGWNPVQAGDDFHHGSQVLEHTNDGRVLYVKCTPLQWPLNHVPAECILESWLELDGVVVKARARLTNARSDKTQYPARSQELPALYANAAFHRVVSYTGSLPFTGADPETIPKAPGPHPWSFWAGTEHWSAVVDANDQGLGLITPGGISFTGGFAGQPGPNDPHATSTGYLASLAQEILDHNIVFESRYELLPGSLKEIRERAFQQSLQRDLPAWIFSKDRQGWHYQNAGDSGWPIVGMLQLDLKKSDPQLLSPLIFWQADAAPYLTIQAAIKSPHHTATIYWRRVGQPAPGPQDSLDFPIISDGEFHQYVVKLADSKSYSGAMMQLRFDPVPKGSEGAAMKLKYLVLSKIPPP